MVIIQEATISNAQQAWDQLLKYVRSRRYSTNDPEIPKIKDCMKILDKCPKVRKKVYKSETWMCTYCADPVQKGWDTNIITITFRKPNSVEVSFWGRGWVDGL